jgi:hypothetical protein
LDRGRHLLLPVGREGPSPLGLGPGDLRVVLGLGCLEVGTDVVPDVDRRDVDRQDVKGRPCVQPLAQDTPRDRRVLQDELVRGGRADGGDDALADPGDDRLLGGPADRPVEVDPHRHAGLDPELDAVLGDPVDRRSSPGRVRAVDDAGVDIATSRT